MNNATHIRKRNVIRQLAIAAVLKDDGTEKKPAQPERVVPFKSINAAKRESRLIQKQGAILRVEK